MAALLVKAGQIEQDIATLIKMIAFYEEKIQSIKGSIWDRSHQNLETSFHIIAKGSNIIQNNSIADLFINNLAAVHTNDVQQLLSLIGDGTAISQKEWNSYIKAICLTPNSVGGDAFPPQKQSELILKVLKLLQLQIKVIREQNNKKQYIISKYQAEFKEIYQLMSMPETQASFQTIFHLMQRTDFEFSRLDYRFFVYHLFEKDHQVIGFDELFHTSFLNPLINPLRHQSVEKSNSKPLRQSFAGQVQPKQIISFDEKQPLHYGRQSRERAASEYTNYNDNFSIIMQGHRPPKPQQPLLQVKNKGMPFQQAYFSDPAQEVNSIPKIKVIPPQQKPIFAQYQPPTMGRSRILEIDTQFSQQTTPKVDVSNTSISRQMGNSQKAKKRSRNYSVSVSR